MCELNIRDIINSSLADDGKKGKLVFDRIVSQKENDQNEIILDFKGVELLNTSFLNNAIGKLFDPKLFDMNKIRIKVSNMNENMLELLRETIKTSRLMYSSWV